MLEFFITLVDDDMGLVILFDMLLYPSFKMTTSFTNIARTAASTSNSYIRKYFKSLGTGSLLGLH